MAANYQDIYFRGRVLERGVRECASRYEAIDSAVLRPYERPFTVLDLGAAEGYFGFRIAAEHRAVAVMADDAVVLGELCRDNDLFRTIHLNRRLSVADLEELALCEHFDVVLALNVLHHFADWRSALAAVLHLGDQVVIETPSAEDVDACGYEAIPDLLATVEGLGGRLIARTPSHTNATLRPMFLVERPKVALTVPYFGAPEAVRNADIRIVSDRRRKTVEIPRKGERREWIPGINLRTYLSLGGSWPERGRVGEWIRSARPVHHGDVRPWNFILDGEAVHLIDGGDDRAADPNDAAALEATAAEVAA